MMTLCECEDINKEKKCPLLFLLIRLNKTEGDLRFVSAYREHFIHSFHVFLLGLTFLRSKFANEELSLANRTIMKVERMQLLKAWFFTAMYHDTAYAIEKMESLAKEYYYRVLLDIVENTQTDKDKKEDVSPFTLDKSSLLVDKAIHNYLLDLKQLEAIGHPLSRALALKADHGILSSFVLYNAIEKSKSKSMNCLDNLFPDFNVKVKHDDKNIKNHTERGLSAVCRAIALHHAYDKHWSFKDGQNGCYHELPNQLKKPTISNALLMLLVLCDSISQAGRTFDIQYTKENISTPEENSKEEGTQPHETKLVKMDYELRLGNIYCLEDRDIVDLVYSPKNDTDSMQDLQKFLGTEGNLILNKDKKDEKGGWYYKPLKMIEQWLSSEKSERKIFVHIYVARHDSIKKKEPSESDVMEITLGDDPITYVFPMPV